MKPVSTELAKKAAAKLGVQNKIDIEQFRRGMEVEQEHADSIDGFNLLTSAKIALDHLKEIPDYYTRLDKMESGAKKENTKEILQNSYNPLKEALTRKDFEMMAKEIRKTDRKHWDVLVRFSILLGTRENPNFDEDRFKQAVYGPSKK